MKGMQRLAGRGPRWVVEVQSLRAAGDPVWVPYRSFYDPVAAFEALQSMQARGGSLLQARGGSLFTAARVMDRLKNMEVLWPEHGWRLPARKNPHVRSDHIMDALQHVVSNTQLRKARAASNIGGSVP